MADHMAAIHADLAPVQRYVEHIKRVFGKDHVVIEIPILARATRRSGYRYTTCDRADLPLFMEAGAKEITPCT